MQQMHQFERFVFRQIVLSGTYYMENLQTQTLTGNANKAAPV